MHGLYKEIDLEYIKQLRAEGYTTKEAAAKLGIGKSTLLRRGYCKLPYTNKCLQTYKRDTSIFKNIDDPDKAYWIGLLLTDGCIKSSGELVLELQEQDGYLVEYFRDFIGGNIPLRSRTKGTSKTVIFAAKSKQYLKDLEQWGITPNKTYKEQNLPDIKEEYIPHFIRGVFDGDGCISKRPRQKGYNLFLTGRYRFVGLIQDYLISKSILTSKTKIQYINHTVEFGRLNIFKQDDIQRMSEYMYANESELYLRRKKEKFMRLYD